MQALTWIAAALLLAGSPLLAQNLPAHWKFSSEIDDSQFGYTDVHIAENGRVTASTLFSNGDKLDGDHFVARVVVFAEDGTPLLGLQYGAGINATGGFGSANEARVGSEGNIDAGLLGTVADVGVSHSTRDTIDDVAFWETLGEIARTIWEAYEASDGQGVGMVTNIPIAYRGTADDVSVEISGVPELPDMARAARVELTPSDPAATVSPEQQFFDERICLNPNCTASVIR